MKTNLSYQTKHQGIENFIEVWKSKLKDLVKLKASDWGRRGLPKPTEDTLQRYVYFIVENIQECIRGIDRILQIVPLIYALEQVRKKRDEMVFELQNRRLALGKRLIELSETINISGAIILHRFTYIILGLLVCLSVAESYMSFPAFVYLVGNFWAALSISATFGIVWFLACEKIATIWDDRGRIVKIAITLICTIVCFGIAHLRSLKMATARAITNDEALPVFTDVNIAEVSILSIIGLVFILAGVWLAKLTPTFKEFTEIIKGGNRQKELFKIQIEIEAIDATIEKENQRIIEREQEVIELLDTRTQAVKQVIGQHRLFIEEFKELNFLNRRDGIYPACFYEFVKGDFDSSLPNIRKDFETHLNNQGL